MTKPSLVLRADAGPETGLGHVSRCCILAKHCVSLVGPAVLLVAPDEEVQAIIRRKGHDLAVLTSQAGSREDARETTRIAVDKAPSALVLDGKEFDSAYRGSIDFQPLVLIDDEGIAAPTTADLVINPNLFASADLYPGIGNRARILIGPRYAMTAVLPGGRRRRGRRSRPRIIALSGGAGWAQAGELLSQAARLLSRQGAHVTVIKGPLSRGGPVIPTGRKISMVENVDDLTPYLAEADLAISAAGSTVWDLAVGRVPAVLYGLSSDQAKLGSALAASNCMAYAGRIEDLSADEVVERVNRMWEDPDGTELMVERAQLLVDPTAAARIVEEIRELLPWA